VNYKKVMLHLQRSFEEAESDLAVFGAILFAGDGSIDGGDASSASNSNEGHKTSRRRQVKLSQELDSLRGILHVIRSVRSSTSIICKTSRFPPPNASTSARIFIASGVTPNAARKKHLVHIHISCQMLQYTELHLIWKLKAACVSAFATCKEDSRVWRNKYETS
jgi:hypothetical protein